MGKPGEIRLVLNLEEATRSNNGLVGAKAANLGELARAGLPVPAGIVLTTAAFERFVEANNLDPGSSPGRAYESAIPDDIARVLLNCTATLGEVALAVRSSSTAEDLPGASFAGQYETVLGVHTPESLFDAVKKCWSSAFGDRIRVYQQAQGKNGTPKMAVLVQRLVEADAAGVAFTANPISGDRNETVVNAVRGLGERLVSGQATPDEWIVRGSEAICYQTTEDSIDAAQARAVARLAGQAESHFGCPQDIEWAIAGTELYLLQARPITTLAPEEIVPVPVPVEIPDGFWQREATHAPLPWTPMTADVLYSVRNRALKTAFEEFGILLEALEMREIGGWEYTRLVPLGGKDRPAPPPYLFWLLARLVPQLRSRIKQSVKAVRSGKAIHLIRRWHTEWQPELEKRIAALTEVDLASLNDSELEEQLTERIALFEEGIKIHFLMHAAIGFLYEIVFTCRELIDWDETKVFEMLNGLSYRSTEPSRRLADLAEMVRKNADAQKVLEKIDGNTLEELKAAYPRFVQAFHKYLREYCCRSIRYEMAEPTLAESLDLVLGLIRDNIRHGYDPAADAAALRETRRKTVEEARMVLSDRPAEERERFERELQNAEETYPVREDNEFYTYSAPSGLLRYGVLEVGQRLAERGQIKKRDDIFFLEMEEARQALHNGHDRSTIINRRRGERAWVLAHPGPATYGKNPGPPPDFSVLPAEAGRLMNGILWYMDRIFAQKHTEQVDEVGGLLAGIAASPGVYRGSARVVMNESEFNKIKAGDVLVCPITSPVWSVLFPNIGALVTDTGGILSHPAIIAREYRVPAVVATGRGTQVLRDGQLVEVNGSAGTIAVLS